MTTTASECVANCLATVEQLTGRRPYEWQARLLADHFLRGDIPDAVDVPTGLGKTAVIALWLSALAHGAPLPRRLIYVVDRRVVVDQATTVAEDLADALGDGKKDGRKNGQKDGKNGGAGKLASSSPAVVACRQALGLEPGQRLPVSTLRGQHVDNRAWLADLSRPSIVVATIDMIGSRLLFSGYGVSPRMRPVHAGLLGADAMLVLDEAHLVPAFEALMPQVQELRRQKETPHVPPFRVMALSATGRTRAPNVFKLQREDLKHDPAAHVRFHASKRFKVVETVPIAALAPALAEHAWVLAESRPAAVLIFCNNRKVAQDACQLLTKRLRETFGNNAEPAELLVGERRVKEREQVVANPIFQRFMPQRYENPPREVPTWPAFLVATSAGEVGIDLDADHLVCDLVAWERMIQRFGRVNRRAEPASDARIVIIPALTDQTKQEAQRPFTPDPLVRHRAPFDSHLWPVDADGWRDASPAQLHWLKSEPQLASILADAETPEPLRPALVPAVIDTWTMTSVDRHSGTPEVQHWIRGWDEDDEPQTRVVWRQHFPLRAADTRDAWESPRTRKDLVEFIEAAPPHLSEALDAPTARVIEVLRKRAESWVASSRTDRTSRASAMAGPPHDPVLLIFSASGELVVPPYQVSRLIREKADALHRLLANRTVIVDARLGGLDERGMLSHTAGPVVTTLDGDIQAWGIDYLTETAGFRVRRGDAPSTNETKDTKETKEHEEGGEGGEDKDDAQKWRVEHEWRSAPEDEEKRPIVLIVEVWRDKKKAGADAFARGDAARGRKNEQLAAHHARMEECIVAIASRLNLPEPYVAMLRFVARMHDRGKAPVEWQNAMGAPHDDGRPYAKTIGRCVPKMLEIAGETYRHELRSLREAQADSLLMKVAEELRPLALHLIAAHHGCARPVIAARDFVAPDTCGVAARDAARRFLEVQAQWGPWALAWWESLVRNADWQASAQSGRQAENE